PHIRTARVPKRSPSQQGPTAPPRGLPRHIRPAYRFPTAQGRGLSPARRATSVRQGNAGSPRLLFGPHLPAESALAARKTAPCREPSPVPKSARNQPSVFSLLPLPRVWIPLLERPAARRSSSMTSFVCSPISGTRRCCPETRLDREKFIGVATV